MTTPIKTLFVNLIALKRHSPEIISGKSLAAVIKLLTLLEKTPGGPYYDENNKLDPQLNILIATWLSLFNVHLKPLDDFLLNAGFKVRAADNKPSPSQKNQSADADYQLITQCAQKLITTLGPHLKPLGKRALGRLLKNDTDRQILLLPWFFKKALGKEGSSISSATIRDLGLANLYLWLAYTAYDDILDGDQATNILPLANIFFKEYIFLVHKIFKNHPDAWEIFSTIIDNMEKANALEINKRAVKRNPKPTNYCHSSLADKSLAHASGPLGLLIILGYKADSPAVKQLRLFFRHYLSARQLNDDAHDWEEDLRHGYWNSISVQIFKFSSSKNISPINYRHWRQIFWEKIFVRYQNQVLSHTKQARKYLASLTVIRNNKYLMDLIKTVEVTAQESLRAQVTIAELIKSTQP